jgi:circadian clock protein KaiC
VTYVSGFKVLETDGLAGVVRSIRDTLAHERPALVAVDGLVTAAEVAPNTTAFKKFLHEIQSIAVMFHILRGVTLVFTAESTDIVGEPIRPPFPNASRMCQNIIVLRYTELAGRVARAIAVTKTRDAGFDDRIREFTVTDRGVEVGASIEGRDQILVGQSRSSHG